MLEGPLHKAYVATFTQWRNNEAIGRNLYVECKCGFRSGPLSSSAEARTVRDSHNAEDQ